jgi:superfamily II DNA or RNA helicase
VDTSNLVQRALYGDSSAEVRTRGRDYVRQGRISLLHCGTTGVEAQVKGAERYTVRLGYKGNAVVFVCNCPAGKDVVCEHVWATVLEADQKEMARPFRVGLAKALSGAVDSAQNQSSDEFLRVPEPLAIAAPAPEVEPQRVFGRWARLLGAPAPPHVLPTNVQGEDWYLLDAHLQAATPYHVPDAKLILQIGKRNFLKRGGLGKPTGLGRPPTGSRPEGIEGTLWDLANSSSNGSVALGRDFARQVLPELAQLGRLGLIANWKATEVVPLSWGGGAPWHVVLDVREIGQDEQLLVEGTLERDGETGREVSNLSRVTPLPVDLLLVGDRLYQLKRGHDSWLRELVTSSLPVGRNELREIAKELAHRPHAPRFRDLSLTGWVPERIPPRPRLRLRVPGKHQRQLTGTLSFMYGDRELGEAPQSLATADRLIERDLEKEALLMEALRGFDVSIGHGPETSIQAYAVSLDIHRLPQIAASLAEAGFLVEVEGKPYRPMRPWHPFVESDQDWFELKGDVEFEGEMLGMPELLRAVRERQHWVRLKDGSVGFLPEAWVESLATLADWMPPKAQQLRFHMSHTKLVEGALGSGVELRTDAGFEAMKARFERFERISPLKKPKGFSGELREYQELALGWLQALDELGFGGCLADDMGLGKTVVVLAWLLRCSARQDKARVRPGERSPSLVVVPKSLLFNWQRECERFAPKLRMLVHHGKEREPPGAHFREFDVVLTSYGTLRRDVQALAGVAFDTIVLDEAHSIKNAWTNAHQAARALTSRRRLALTGTPIENHLGELWNLMSFLNPEVFAALGHLQKAFEQRRPSETALDLVLKRTLGPFILRRTKAEVAKDLPPRTEKTLHVTLSKDERKLYDDLAQFYRRRIIERKAQTSRFGARGKGTDNARQTAEALEALLRLRQAACHPGLLDETRKDQPSAKLDLLLEQLEALRGGGHKALVFSQFTKLLALVKPRLEEAGIAYSYLDGQTNHRDVVVDTFQNDPNIGVFLISLKAGGVGLNLVAADYVFLLDPWWNPASEAQAIDRAHRIGQTKSVIAYRLLTQGTIEEKVAKLQDEKRELANALFADNASFAAKFTREDLEALLEV